MSILSKWFKDFSFEDFFKQIWRIIKKVEKDFVGKSGEEKKKAAVKLINEFVNIPVLPEALEAVLIEILIDFAIYLLNQAFGKNWLSKQDAKFF